MRSARAHASTTSDVFKLPLGFEVPGFKDHLADALTSAWAALSRDFGPPTRLWLPFGSGTLLSVFRRVVPVDVVIHAVNVRVLDGADERVRRARTMPNVCFHSTPERFHEEARTAPPVPSNAFYDAKLWRFITSMGKPGDVWWNVAR